MDEPHRERGRAADLHPSPATIGAAALLAVFLLALIPRLIGLDNPPVGVHAWRQCDTAAVARAFARETLDLTRPRVEWRGPGTGEVEMEFPVYCWTAGVLMRVLGEHDWISRLLGAIGSAAGAPLLAALAARLQGPRVGLLAGVLFAVLPLNVYYGRSIQPDAWMLTAAIAGVYAFLLWCESGRIAWIGASAVATALALLLKLPAVFVGVPLAYLAIARFGVRAFLQPLVIAHAVFVAACAAAWYAHAHRLGVETSCSLGVLGGPVSKFGDYALLGRPSFWNTIVFRRMAERHMTWPGFAAMLGGIALAWWRPAAAAERYRWLWHAWFGGVLVTFLLAPRPAEMHEYYQLPLVVPGAVFAAACLAAARGRWRWLAAGAGVAIVVFSALRVTGYLRVESRDKYGYLAAGREIGQATRAGEVIISVDTRQPGSPILLYLADRKGWSEAPEILDRTAIDWRADAGATALAVMLGHMDSPARREWLAAMRASYPVRYESPRVVCYEISPAAPPGR